MLLDIYFRFCVHKVWLTHVEKVSFLYNAYLPNKYKFQATSSHLKDKIAKFRYLKPVYVFIYTISFPQVVVKQQ